MPCPPSSTARTSSPSGSSPPSAAVPKSLRAPPRAHLSSSPPQQSIVAPRECFVELVRPDGTLFSPSEPSQRATASSSRRSSASASSQRRTSVANLKQLGATEARADDETSGSTQRARGASVSQLSWGNWWPFQVVAPESAEDRPPTPPQKEEEGNSWLSLFAGKQTVDAVRREHRALADQDQAEADLLDTDLDALRRLSLSTTSSNGDQISREADDSPFRPMPPTNKSLPPTPGTPASSLPSLFSGTPSRGSSAATSPSSKSLLSSFTLANPFSSTLLSHKVTSN